MLYIKQTIIIFNVERLNGIYFGTMSDYAEIDKHSIYNYYYSLLLLLLFIYNFKINTLCDCQYNKQHDALRMIQSNNNHHQESILFSGNNFYKHHNVNRLT